MMERPIPAPLRGFGLGGQGSVMNPEVDPINVRGDENDDKAEGVV